MRNNGADILRLCQKGKKQGFELLFRHYSPILMGVAYRYVKDDAKAKDVLQNAFINIFKNIKNYRDTGSFEAWLKKITVNCALKELRLHRKNLELVAQFDNEDLPDVAVDPLIFERFDEKDILELLNTLNDDLRIAFNMYIIEGYSYSEISKLLNITESHSRMRVSRARKKLKELLTEQKDHYGFAKS